METQSLIETKNRKLVYKEFGDIDQDEGCPIYGEKNF